MAHHATHNRLHSWHWISNALSCFWAFASTFLCVLDSLPCLYPKISAYSSFPLPIIDWAMCCYCVLLNHPIFLPSQIHHLSLWILTLSTLPGLSNYLLNEWNFGAMLKICVLLGSRIMRHLKIFHNCKVKHTCKF